jgi:hypothetical protein
MGNIMQSAVSGLNRGLAANEDDLRKADAAAKEIEDVGGLVDLSVDLDKLQGRWKLIYSSAFSSRTLGGSRPGPPTGRLLPITLGQVCYQNCSIVLSSTWYYSLFVIFNVIFKHNSLYIWNLFVQSGSIWVA